MKNKSKKKLILPLVLLIGIGVTIAYFFSSSTFSNIFLAKTVPTIITREKFESPDGWKPGDTTEKTITTENKDSDDDICIRVKFDEAWVDSEGNTLALYQNGNKAAIINFSNWSSNKWTLADDGWYYYQVNLSKGDKSESPIESVTFNPLITADEECDEETEDDETTRTCTSSGNGYDGATYTLDITTEAIECDMVDEVWGPEYTPKYLSKWIHYLYATGDGTELFDYYNYYVNEYNDYHEEDEQLDYSDTNIRYIGSNPDNYITFNNETWRISGIYKVDDGSGNVELRTKIYRETPLYGYTWDVEGKTTWNSSTLMNELNTDYLDNTLTADTNWAASPTDTNEFNYTIALGNDAQSLIDDAVWNIKEYDFSNVNNDLGFIINGLGYLPYSINSTWKGKVGLLDYDDIIYSIGKDYDGVGYNNYGVDVYGDRACALKDSQFNIYAVNDDTNDDYFDNNKFNIPTIGIWSMSPFYGGNIVGYTTNDVVFTKLYSFFWTSLGLGCAGGFDYIDSDINQKDQDYVSPSSRSGYIFVLPTIYLKADVIITGGSGTSTDPYQISI